MALPNLDVPRFNIKVPGIEEEILARPFLVKEGNILTQAAASDISSQFLAVQQVIENCTFGEVAVKKLEMYQLQYIFLKLKGRSTGPEQEFVLTCGKCETKINYTMDMDSFETVGNTEENRKDIRINDKGGIIFKRPSAEVMIQIDKLSDLEVILNCVEAVYDTEETTVPEDLDPEEFKEFIENLPLAVLEEAREFLSATPVLGKAIQFKCSSCGTANEAIINGVEHFFV